VSPQHYVHSLSLCWISCSQLDSLCWICYSQLRSLLLEWLPTAQSLCWSITAHSSAHKSRFYLPCDGVLSKKSGFLERSSSALAILLKAEGEPLPRKIGTTFSLRGPQHVLSGRKWKRNKSQFNELFMKNNINKNKKSLGSWMKFLVHKLLVLKKKIVNLATL